VPFFIQFLVRFFFHFQFHLLSHRRARDSKKIRELAVDRIPNVEGRQQEKRCSGRMMQKLSDVILSVIGVLSLFVFVC
jgi:hypothetical protein